MLIPFHMRCKDLLIPVSFFSISSWCLFGKLKILTLMTKLEIFFFFVISSVYLLFIFTQSHKTLFVYCFIASLFTFMTFIYLKHTFVECGVSAYLFLFFPHMNKFLSWHLLLKRLYFLPNL